MMTTRRLLALTLGFGLCALTIGDAVARDRIEIGDLQLSSPADCARLAGSLEGNARGGQWLIGPRIELFGLPGSRRPLQTLEGAFDRVGCYYDVPEEEAAVEARVFVAAVDDSFCGWVARDDLLDEHRNRALALHERQSEAICETPRAMTFDRYCEELDRLASEDDETCRGVPPGLRAKGVLIGSTLESLTPRYPFMTAPIGGEPQDSRQFFSVLEIHDVAHGQGGQVMVLAGGGEGDMFGWIDRRAIELWPTRLGLFYDEDGLGRMFQRQRDLIDNWRHGGTPAADITPGLDQAALEDYIHGELPLLSYPITRTIDPATDRWAGDPSDVQHHEVIFLGQTGEGSASELMDEAAYARRAEAVRRLNVMLVVDTTESMRNYLQFVQTGVARFIDDYELQSLDPANQLPDMRIAVHAYSDFLDRDRTGPSDPIRTEELMPPQRIGVGFDIGTSLNRITSHRGLRDEAGLREEAALEAVAQLSNRFADDAWFDDGPRVIIHIADHGSRDGVSLPVILDRLGRNRTHYFPVAVVTDDLGARDRQVAREAFMDQAVAMLIRSGLVPNAEDDDVARIDLIDFESATPAIVQDRLHLVMDEVIQLIFGLRAQTIGDDLAAVSERARDLASSRYLLDEALMREFDLDRPETGVIVQARTGLAPLRVHERGREQVVDWIYTVALEPGEARFLQQSFTQMCGLVGFPAQREAFRRLIVRLAEVFSGDEVRSDGEVRAILADLADLPGAEGSFLAQPRGILLARADSTDERVVEELRHDICWTSYHLNNMEARLYARPGQVVWAGVEFALRSGEEVTSRDYRYRPMIGADTIYLPGFFFVPPRPGDTPGPTEAACEFFCD